MCQGLFFNKVAGLSPQAASELLPLTGLKEMQYTKIYL